jgi:hypothetical protein
MTEIETTFGEIDVGMKFFLEWKNVATRFQKIDDNHALHDLTSAELEINDNSKCIIEREVEE